MKQKIETPASKDFFLPDFCQVQSVFLVLLIGELLAVLFTILNYTPGALLWNLLGLYSISIQIVSLTSVAVLCVLRPYFSTLNDWLGGMLSWLIILLTTLIFTLFVIRVYWLQSIDLSVNSQQVLLIRNLFTGGLIGAVALRYFYLQQQYRKHIVLESAARLDALQARIRPHFLFNSMNVIASLTRLDPKKAETAIEDLSDLFRATFSRQQSLIPLQEELENSERYLALEQLRLGDRLVYTKQIDPEALSVEVPPLCIQPLLENAVYHGIQQLPEGGEVKLTVRCEEQSILLTVSNPKAPHGKGTGHGIALQNISQRLAMIYSGKAEFTKQSEAETYLVTLRIPKVKPDY